MYIHCKTFAKFLKIGRQKRSVYEFWSRVYYTKWIPWYMSLNLFKQNLLTIIQKFSTRISQIESKFCFMDLWVCYYILGSFTKKNYPEHIKKKHYFHSHLKIYSNRHKIREDLYNGIWPQKKFGLLNIFSSFTQGNKFDVWKLNQM